MSAVVEILRAGPLATIQDAGRPGMLRYGIAASGPMDRAAFVRAGAWLGAAGAAGIEFTQAGIALKLLHGTLAVACDGGHFVATRNGEPLNWPTRLVLQAGDTLDVSPGTWGNYGYLCFDAELELAPVLGSRATNVTAGLGGLEGRALRTLDRLQFGLRVPPRLSSHPKPSLPDEGPIRVLWGLHADLFPGALRQRLLAERFRISPRLDRMGVSLDDPTGVFAGWSALSLVSDAVVPGDIQILGDGTPTVLMRDHQPVGGYPRIATVLSVDLDRLAQLRPGTTLEFVSVSPDHARQIVQGARP